MKKILFLSFLCLLCNVLLGQVVEFKLINNTITNLEPIEIKLLLKNIDNKPKLVFKPFGDFINPSLQYKRRWQRKWHYLAGQERYMEGDAILHYKPKLVFKNIVTKIYFKGFVAFTKDILTPYKYQLRSGKYHLRLLYKPNDSTFLCSNKQTLIVKKYEGEDKKIYDELSKLKMPHFLFETVYNYTEGTNMPIEANAQVEENIPNNIEIAQKILREHPESRFVLWAKLHIIANNLYKVSEINRKKVQVDIPTLLVDSETMLKTIEKEAENDEFIAYCVTQIKKKIQQERSKLPKN